MKDEIYCCSEEDPIIGHFLIINLDGKKFYSLETVEMYQAAKELYVNQGYFWSYTDFQHGEPWDAL